jgi:hypothetical protein
MAKGGSGLAAFVRKAGRSALNSAAPWPGPEAAQARVLGIQRKLHKWAEDDREPDALPGEDPHQPHRRGNRVPRLAHPAPPGLERPRLRLHLRLQAVASGGQGEGQGDHSLRTQPDARPSAAPAQPGAQGLVRPLSRRGVRSHLQLPARLHLGDGLPAGRARKHPKANWRWLKRRYLPRWWPPTARRPSTTQARCGSSTSTTAGRRSPRRGIRVASNATPSKCSSA